MLSDIALIFIIIAAVVALFVWNRVPVVIVALGTAISLYLTGVLDPEEAVAGLGDPAVIFIALLFVVSAGLDVSGVTAWGGQLLIAKAGKSRTRLLILIMVLVSLLTALISVNGAVAALLPVVVVTAIRLNRATSQLLMPLVFSAHAGSLLALTGSPVNVLVSEAAGSVGVGAFSYFEFAFVGVPLILGTMAIILLFGERLLPERSGRTMPTDLSSHARTLIEEYRLDEGIIKLSVRPGSPYIGMQRDVLEMENYPGLTLVGVKSGGGARDGADLLNGRTLVAGDILIMLGDAEAAANLAIDKKLAIRSDDEAGDVADTLFNRASGLAEVIIPPRSPLVGERVFPGMVTPSGDLIILAVQRRGEDQGLKEIKLTVGDTLLLQGTWKALAEHLDFPEVLVVDSPELVRRQALPLGPGAKQAIAVLIAMVVLLATGLVPAVIVGLLAACALILLGVLTVGQAYQAINWTTVIMVGAMMPLSTAMVKSGAAAMLAETLVRVIGDAGPYALLAGLFVLTATLGQLISNTATALIIIPIALSAANGMGISQRPVLMSVAVAAAGAFLTPVATAVNLMVKGPGGYHFGDYAKLGLPLLLWFFVVATFLVPIFWRF
jgi:di/tricarboxylate transporter